MTANWYHLLDVEQTASAEEIRAAWKSAVADMDPTNRTFRVYNQAAEVLLDPASRAAYDAGLPAADDETPVEPATSAAPVSLEKAGEAEADADPVPAGSRRPVPAWLLVGLALLTALVGTGAVALGTMRPSDAAVANATAEAESAAQRAVPAIFSYDYHRLPADHDEAAGMMTADYRKRYDPLFEVINENAPGLQTVTEAQLIASGVVRAGNGADADNRVQIFVVFDQLTSNKSRTTAASTPAFATLTMERVGDAWLVDDVQGPPVPK